MKFIDFFVLFPEYKQIKFLLFFYFKICIKKHK